MLTMPMPTLMPMTPTAMHDGQIMITCSFGRIPNEPKSEIIEKINRNNRIIKLSDNSIQKYFIFRICTQYYIVLNIHFNEKKFIEFKINAGVRKPLNYLDVQPVLLLFFHTAVHTCNWK